MNCFHSPLLNPNLFRLTRALLALSLCRLALFLLRFTNYGVPTYNTLPKVKNKSFHTPCVGFLVFSVKLMCTHCTSLPLRFYTTMSVGSLLLLALCTPCTIPFDIVTCSSVPTYRAPSELLNYLLHWLHIFFQQL